MTSDEERMQILELIDNGKISAEEGMRLIKALGSQPPPEVESRLGQAAIPLEESQPSNSGVDGASSESFQAEVEDAPQPAFPSEKHLPPHAEKWKRWWMLPLWLGVGVTVLGGLFMYQAMQSSGYGFWFFCATVPFILGMVIMVLAWQSRNSPWLHLRVDQKPGESPQRIAFSFPLPIRPTAWFLRTFGHKIPKLENTAVDEVITALGKSVSADNPIFIEVGEDDGEHVEIYIG